MKKITLMAALALIAGSAAAQQNLFGDAQVKSPEVNADGTIPIAVIILLILEILVDLLKRYQTLFVL